MASYRRLLNYCFKLLLFFVIFYFLTGCNFEHKAFAPYANATLTAGVGLGNIKLGETTLGWVVETFGQGQVSVLYGDDTSIELEFIKGEIRFNFFVSGQCQQDTHSPISRLSIEHGIKRFLEQYPSCQNLPLTRLYLTARNTKANKTFYQGSTDQGIKLWDYLTEVDVFPNPGINIGMTEISKQISYIETLESLSIRPGLDFYYQGATDYEIRSGKPLSEKRLKEIEEEKNQLPDQIVVRQFMIYLPKSF